MMVVMEQAIMKVMALPDVAPSPAVNAAFSALVASVVRCQNLPAWCDASLCRDVQCRCAASEAAMEVYWARRIISAKQPRKELARFWYGAHYQELVRREVGLLAGSGKQLTTETRVAMIGSGPLPLTGWYLWQQTAAQLTLIDSNPEATDLAAALAQALDWTVANLTDDGATIALPLEAYDVIYVAGLAGGDRAVKQRIIDNVLPALKSDGRLVVRAATGAKSLLYPALAVDDLRQVRPLVAYHPHDEIINSVYVYAKEES